MSINSYNFAAFVEYPMNTTLIYPMETTATFRCCHESRGRLDWLINGSDFRQFPDLNPSLGFLRDNGTVVEMLSIIVTPEHNSTKIACVAMVDGAPVVSPNATLTIILGLLHSVHSN